MCDAAPAVAGSCESGPAIAPRTSAASVTERTIGPGTSKSGASGRIPKRLTSPSVVFTPTTPFASDGLRIEPEVSAPIVPPGSAVDAATPDPARDPEGENSGSCALITWPASELYPGGICRSTQPANSD